jgi:hypothetical protein
MLYSMIRVQGRHLLEVIYFFFIYMLTIEQVLLLFKEVVV